MNLVYDDPKARQRYSCEIEGGLQNDGSLTTETAGQIHEKLTEWTLNEFGDDGCGMTAVVKSALAWCTVDGTFEPIRKVLEAER